MPHNVCHRGSGHLLTVKKPQPMNQSSGRHCMARLHWQHGIKLQAIWWSSLLVSLHQFTTSGELHRLCRTPALLGQQHCSGGHLSDHTHCGDHKDRFRLELAVALQLDSVAHEVRCIIDTAMLATKGNSRQGLSEGSVIASPGACQTDKLSAGLRPTLPKQMVIKSCKLQCAGVAAALHNTAQLNQHTSW